MIGRLPVTFDTPFDLLEDRSRFPVLQSDPILTRRAVVGAPHSYVQEQPRVAIAPESSMYTSARRLRAA